MNKSDITVEYLDHMGSDLTTVDVARVSFNKRSNWGYTETTYQDEEPEQYLLEQDVKLIDYLAKHDHWSPYGHSVIQMRFKAPIFIARQLGKHQIGLVWNEVSRRYIDSEPEFYIPSEWRGKPVNKKQGSSDIVIDNDQLYDIYENGDDYFSYNFDTLVDMSINLYNVMIERGVAPEMARMVLPQNMMTQWIWTGSLYAFARIYNLRSKPDAQKENHLISSQISDIASGLFPHSWKALTK